MQQVVNVRATIRQKRVALHWFAFSCVAIFTFALSACSDSKPPEDSPRLTAGEAKNAIYAAARAQSYGTFGCSNSTIRYRGEGVWECGKWTYDETAGRAILVSSH